MKYMNYGRYYCLFVILLFLLGVNIQQANAGSGKRKKIKNVLIGAAAGAGTYHVARKVGKGLKPDWDDDDDDWRYGYDGRNRYRQGRRGSALSQCSNGRDDNGGVSYGGDFYCPRYHEPDNFVGCCRDDNGFGYCCPWYQSGAFIGLAVGVVVIVIIIIAVCCCCICYFRKKGSSMLGKFMGGGGGGRQSSAPPPAPSSYPMSSYPPAGQQYQPYPTAGGPGYPPAPYAYPTSNQPPYPTSNQPPYPTYNQPAYPTAGYPVAK